MRKATFAAALAAFTLCTSAVPAFAAGTETNTENTENQGSVETNAVYIDDCSAEDWYGPAVRYSVKYGLMDYSPTISGENNFNPDDNIQRQEVAETIYRTAKMVDSALAGEYSGMSAKEKRDFVNVKTRFKPGVQFCAAAEIMTGDDKGYLHPLDTITREEYAAVLARFVELLAGRDLMDGVVEADGMAVKEFTDYGQISEWAVNPVALCLKNGLMKGNAGGAFNPKGNVTRAQMAQVLYNLAPAGAK